MGIRYQDRKRMESLKDVPDELLASLGTDDINFEKFDEQQIYDNVNKRLDAQQDKINRTLINSED